MATHGCKWKTGHPKVHKAPGWSQLSKSDTGTLGPNDPTQTDALTRLDIACLLEQTPSLGATQRAQPNGHT